MAWGLGMPDKINDRQKEILDVVQTRGYVTIENLATYFGVSDQTVRRDIIHLDSLSLLKRFHGGAGTKEGIERRSYTQKKGLESSAKIRIAKRLASLVPKGSTVFLDVGTTIEAAATELARMGHVHVFSVSFNAALAFAGAENVTVEIAGGLLGGPDGSVVGSRTTDWLSSLRFDYAVIGCSVIEKDGTVIDFDPQKIAVKQAAMRHARQNILLADHTKFGRSALMRIADISAFDLVITDQEPSNDLSASVELIVAE